MLLIYTFFVIYFVKSVINVKFLLKYAANCGGFFFNVQSFILFWIGQGILEFTEYKKIKNKVKMGKFFLFVDREEKKNTQKRQTLMWFEHH